MFTSYAARSWNYSQVCVRIRNRASVIAGCDFAVFQKSQICNCLLVDIGFEKQEIKFAHRLLPGPRFAFDGSVD